MSKFRTEKSYMLEKLLEKAIAAHGYDITPCPKCKGRWENSIRTESFKDGITTYILWFNYPISKGMTTGIVTISKPSVRR